MAEEKTFSVGVQTSSPKRISITSNVSENPITATSDTGLYYSQLAKNWAIGEGLIENTDYSSKAYAQESKAYALDSKAYSETASLDLNNLNNAITQYDEQITNTVATGLAEITTLQESSLLEIGTLRTSAVEDITTNKTNALFDITSAENNALANIETDLNNATNEIQNVANSSIEDINKTGLDTKVSKSGDTMTGYLLGVTPPLSDKSTKLATTDFVRSGGWDMPSTKSVILTVGASKSTYIMPANGFLNVGGRLTSTSGGASFQLTGNGLNYLVLFPSGTSGSFRDYIPVKKGDSISFSYNNLTIDVFNFIYAQGEV